MAPAAVRTAVDSGGEPEDCSTASLLQNVTVTLPDENGIGGQHVGSGSTAGAAGTVDGDPASAKPTATWLVLHRSASSKTLISTHD